jgi:hypothetical protein
VLKICWEIVNKSRNIKDNGQTVTMTDNKIVLLVRQTRRS